MRICVLGASGYIGSHLVPRLLGADHEVVAVSRNARVLEGRGWTGATLVEADVLKPETLTKALRDCDAVYYLVHSMGEGKGFARRDKQAARNVAAAAAKARVKRIVYLGGLQPRRQMSEHLRSRAETGAVLREGSVPVTELRAGIIVGAGSAGFEIIRDLVNHLPAMTLPRWVRSRTSPIALDDVVSYLAGCLETPETTGRTFDIGGPEILPYGDLLRQCAEVLGKRRLFIPVPFLNVRLSSYWLALVTSVPSSVAFPLVEGLKKDLIPRDHAIADLIPLELKTYREGVRAALEDERSAPLPARWTEGAMRFRGYRQDVSFYSKGERTQTPSTATPEQVWDVVCSIGGKQGYFFGGKLWMLRGWMDKAVGGPGLRRGRRHPTDIRLGDTIDFWRVAAIEPGVRLTLVAEMRLPGEAALEFEVEPGADCGSTLVTTARFHPRGLLGMLYWYSVIPFHNAIFTRMPRAMVRRAEERATAAQRANVGQFGHNDGGLYRDV